MMEDFRDYRPSVYKHLYWSASKIFEQQLQQNGVDVLIDGVQDRVLIAYHTNPLNEDKEDRKLKCRLSCLIDRGSIVEWKGSAWLVITQVKDHDVYKECKIYQCNQTLNIQVGAEEKIIDYDPLGRPITKKTPIIYTTPCIASTKLYINSYTNKDAQINLPYGQIIVQFPYNPDYQVEPDMEFDMYGSHYKIFDIDKTSVINEKGVVKIIAEKVADSS